MNNRPTRRALHAASVAALLSLSHPALADNWFGNGTRISYGHNRTTGSGAVKEESRSAAGAVRLVLALPADVTLTQGATESMSVSADDNLLPLIQTRVSGNELVVEGEREKGFTTRNPIKIRLTVKSLESVSIKGSGDVHGDAFTTPKFEVSIAGSGDVRFRSLKVANGGTLAVGIRGSGDVILDEVEAGPVSASISGSGDIKLPSIKAASVDIRIKGSGDVSAAGSADKVDVEIMGSGDARLRDLVSREATVKVVAAGDVTVHAKEKLTASVSGSGDIRYAGAPPKVEKSVRGSGNIAAL